MDSRKRNQKDEEKEETEEELGRCDKYKKKMYHTDREKMKAEEGRGKRKVEESF